MSEHAEDTDVYTHENHINLRGFSVYFFPGWNYYTIQKQDLVEQVETFCGFSLIHT